MKTYLQSIQESSIEIFDAKVLLAHVLHIETGALRLHDNSLLTSPQYDLFQSMVQRRLAGEPADLIIGSRGFYLGEFKVTPDVLSPRPDTECIIEGILNHISNRKDEPLSILDLGTGSGCIVISLLMSLNNANGTGVDISTKALQVARHNAEVNDVSSKATFIQSNWLDTINETFDIIVSNPPYIPTADIEGLQTEVKCFDPMLALDGGDDGLNPYHIIAQGAHAHLNPNGIIAVEYGFNQAEQILEIFTDNGFEIIDSLYDLNQINRGLLAKRGINTPK